MPTINLNSFRTRFHSQEIDDIELVRSKFDIADVLTKTTSQYSLYRTLISNKLKHPID